MPAADMGAGQKDLAEKMVSGLPGTERPGLFWVPSQGCCCPTPVGSHVTSSSPGAKASAVSVVSSNYTGIFLDDAGGHLEARIPRRLRGAQPGDSGDGGQLGPGTSPKDISAHGCSGSQRAESFQPVLCPNRPPGAAALRVWVLAPAGQSPPPAGFFHFCSLGEDMRARPCEHGGSHSPVLSCVLQARGHGQDLGRCVHS